MPGKRSLRRAHSAWLSVLKRSRQRAQTCGFGLRDESPNYLDCLSSRGLIDVQCVMVDGMFDFLGEDGPFAPQRVRRPPELCALASVPFGNEALNVRSVSDERCCL